MLRLGFARPEKRLIYLSKPLPFPHADFVPYVSRIVAKQQECQNDS